MVFVRNDKDSCDWIALIINITKPSKEYMLDVEWLDNDNNKPYSCPNALTRTGIFDKIEVKTVNGLLKLQDHTDTCVKRQTYCWQMSAKVDESQLLVPEGKLVTASMPPKAANLLPRKYDLLPPPKAANLLPRPYDLLPPPPDRSSMPTPSHSIKDFTNARSKKAPIRLKFKVPIAPTRVRKTCKTTQLELATFQNSGDKLESIIASISKDQISVKGDETINVIEH